MGLEQRADPFDAGPYNRIQVSLGLIRGTSLGVGKRAALLAFIAWFPLVVLSAAEGHLLGETPRDAMLLDVAAHVRYLIALPLLVVAEAIVPFELGSILRHFTTAGLVAETSRPRFNALIDSTRRSLASPKTDIVILLLAYFLTLAVRPPLYAENVSTWVRPGGGDIHQLSLAGWWRAFVSQPLYLLLTIGWLWRVILWGRFLACVSRLELNLVPSHPDHAGGLGFVGTSIRGFLVLAFALSVPGAGGAAQGILFAGQKLSDYYSIITGIVIAQLVIFVGPLLFLLPTLLRSRTSGVLQYDALAKLVGHDFEQRWLGQQDRAATRGKELSTPDFSATTDLYSIAASTHQMRLVPMSAIQVTTLLMASLLPFVPVAAITLPLNEILRYIAKLAL